ncbi:MAG: hypothetical protein HY301_06250 [Verrucomicrobia bacterium]|nr:hypothetical protein [Verrucomicrobiota bacterium]
MRKLLLIFLFGLAGIYAHAADKKSGQTSVLIVVGAGGEEEYETAFAKWAPNWQQACKLGGARATTIGLKRTETNSLERIQKTLAAEPKDSAEELWLVLLGHGTSDGREAKFNLRGDDLTSTNLARMLRPFSRPVAVIASFSSSGAFLKDLSAPGRVLVSATRNGAEQNYSRFGGFLSETIADPTADLDKDGQVSLLEAFLAAARRTADFYEGEGRLASEHPVLDDNGDGLATPADWFRGVRAVKRPRDGQTDGLRAHQLHLIRNQAERDLPAAVRAQRDALELQLAALRDRKGEMKEEDYYGELEKLLLQIAKLYAAGEKNAAAGKPTAP